jgi:hypothetical protein
MCVIAVLVSLGVGFAVGRIKNAAKLRAINAEIGTAEQWTTSEARDLWQLVRNRL